MGDPQGISTTLPWTYKSVFFFIQYPLFWWHRATLPDLVRRSYATSDGTNRSLAKFYPNFWCGSFLYDKYEGF